MNEHDGAQFKVLVDTLHKTYRGFPADPQVVKAWWQALKPWTLAEFELACRHWLASQDRMPTPAGLAEIIRARRPVVRHESTPGTWYYTPEVATVLKKLSRGQVPTDQEIAAIGCEKGEDNV